MKLKSETNRENLKSQKLVFERIMKIDMIFLAKKKEKYEKWNWGYPMDTEEDRTYAEQLCAHKLDSIVKQTDSLVETMYLNIYYKKRKLWISLFVLIKLNNY